MLRLNSTPVSGLELSFKVGFGEGASTEQSEWQNFSTPISIFQGRGVLYPLGTISFHFNLPLCVTEILHELRTQSSEMISNTILPLSCFLSPPAAKALGSVTFLTIYLAEPLFLATCAHKMAFLPVHFVLQGAKGMKPEPPPPVFVSEHLAAGFEVLVIPGDVFVYYFNTIYS